MGGPPPEVTENKEESNIRESVSEEDIQDVKREGKMSALRGSSGPGGQSVNTTSSTGEFRWKPAESRTFNDDEKALIIAWMNENKPSQYNKKGEIFLSSTNERSLKSNQDTVLEMLQGYLDSALTIEKPRGVTKVPKGVKEKRKRKKQERGQTKKMRGRVSRDDY
jgi:ribosome-associated protein